MGKAKCAKRRFPLELVGCERDSPSSVSSPAAAYYFKRFGFCAPQIAEPPHPDLGIIVVIPCFNEPDLLSSLKSLWRCERPSCALEVIVVMNSGEGAAEEVLQQNRRSLQEAESWSREECDRSFRVHLLDAPNLPRKHAGVGLARKIGMDEALSRFDSLNRLSGVILCFDADSECAANYLIEVEDFFRSSRKSPGCSIYFEHPLEGPEAPEVYEAITLYELHLRYYVQALRSAGFPHAFHTIGSSMAVRTEAYLAQGGMNKRQAGEDFYFLHKIIPLGHFGEVNTTRVIPSPRPSERVPFGTGRAVREFLATRKFETYPIEAFHDLKQLFAAAADLRNSPARIRKLSAPLQEFLSAQNAVAALEEIRRNTSTIDNFQKRFFRWFDGFMAMKYIHHARDTAYGRAEIIRSARELLNTETKEARGLLLRYRALQKVKAFK